MKLRSRLSRAVLATAGCCCAPTPLLADAGALAIVPAEVTTSALTKTGAGTLLLNSASTTINAGTITSSAIHAGVLSLDGGTITVGSWLALGRGGGQGVMNQSGGVLSANANNATIGSFGATGGAGGTVTTLQGAVVGGLSLGTVTISRGALIGNGAMGPFLPSSQGTTASSTSPGSMSVNSGRATATRFLSPQSATWSTVSGTLNTSGGTLSVGGVSNGVLNVAGTGSLTSGTLRLLRTNPIGTVSLLDGGTIVGSPVINSAGTGIFNFKPALTNRSPTINVSAPNLGGISLNGSNSTETPIVQIGGGGISSGIGASAIANIDSSGNLIGITLASPGNSYAIAGSPMLSPSSASSATLSAVPEPSSLVLAGLALTTLFAARRFCS